MSLKDQGLCYVNKKRIFRYSLESLIFHSCVYPSSHAVLINKRNVFTSLRFEVEQASCGLSDIAEHLLILALYIQFACLCCLLPHLSFFLLVFPYLSTPLVMFSFENRPGPFPGRMS